MIDSVCGCIGVGMTRYDGITYCYMFVGISNSVNFYAKPNMKQSGAFRAMRNAPFVFLFIGRKSPVKYCVPVNNEIGS